MASVCISNCVKDARDVRMPVRATYRNLYKWPESDAEFVRSVSANMRRGVQSEARVVDSISCRQMYLRSYTFTRKADETTPKCFGKVKEKVRKKKKSVERRRTRKRKCFLLRSAIFSFFRTLLSCTASVDVVLVDPN